MGRRPDRNGSAQVGVPVVLLAAIGLAGCGGSNTASAPPPPPPPPAPPAPAKPAAKPVPPPGLTPLATPQQVVNAIEVGRADPFAPSQPPPGTATTRIGPDGKPVVVPPRPTLPDGFKLTGVIRTGGRAQAFVQIGDQSGPLCPGPRGRCSGAGAEQPLLPPGWSVTGIDAANGLLAVSFGRQRQVIPLAP